MISHEVLSYTLEKLEGNISSLLTEALCGRKTRQTFQKPMYTRRSLTGMDIAKRSFDAAQLFKLVLTESSDEL